MSRITKWIAETADGMVRGVNCQICGHAVNYSNAVHKSDAVCPQCDSAICSECANLFEPQPKTEAEVRKYIAASDLGMSMAYCGQCGNYGHGYLTRYLKIVDAPIPEDFLHPPQPDNCTIVLQARVASLPGCTELTRQAAAAFQKGYRGLIKLKHATGEIWGIPEHHAEYKWVITLCYPEDR